MDQTCGSQTAGVYTCGVSGQEVEAIVVAANGGNASRKFNFER